MKKTFTNLLSAIALTFLFAIPSMAQFEGTVEEIPVGYKTYPIKFNLTDVSQALGFETSASFAEAWEQSSLETADVKPILVECPDTLGGYSTNYTQSTFGGFWMNAQGQVVDWVGDVTTTTEKSRPVFYDIIEIDTDSDLMRFHIGQYPDVCAVGDTYTATIRVTNQGAVAPAPPVVTFTLRLQIKEPSKIEEPVTVLSKLNIVGKETITVHQVPRNTTTADVVGTDVGNMLQALGCTADQVSDNITSIMFTYKSVIENITELVVISDSLTNTPTAGTPPSWWFSKLEIPEDPNGGFYDSCYAVSYGESSYFYTEAWRIDGDSIFFNIGQYPNKFKANERAFSDIFVINGSNAYKYTVELLIDEPENIETGDWVKVGSLTLDYVQEVRQSYDTQTNSVDINEVMEKVGVSSTSDLIVYWSNGMEGDDLVISDAYNADPNPGFYLTADGNIGSWTSGDPWYVLVDPTSGTVEVGQYPNKVSVGDNYQTTLMLAANGKYYELKINLDIQAEDRSDWEQVDAVDWIWEAIGGQEYVQDSSAVFTYYEEIQNILGTQSPTFMAQSSVEGETWTSATTCNPPVGYWCNWKGQATAWTNQTRIAICFDVPDKKFISLLMADSTGVPQVGETFTAPYIFANETEKTFVLVNITVNMVSEKSAATAVVASDEMTIDLGTSDEMGQREYPGVTINLFEAANLENAPEWWNTDLYFASGTVAVSNKAYYISGSDNSDGNVAPAPVPWTWMTAEDATALATWWYGADGKSVNAETNPDDVKIEVMYDKPNLIIFPYSPLAKKEAYKFGVKFAYDDEAVVFDLTVAEKEAAVGITNIEVRSGATTNNVYDMNGRLVRSQVTDTNGLARGLYIVNGKKVLVK